MKLFIIFLAFLTQFAFSKDNLKLNKSEFGYILDSLKLEGSILIYDSKNNIFYSNDFKRAEKGFIPASTFKIPNTIIGLELGVINDTTIFKWDGKPRRFKGWEQDLNLKKAFRESCVPCYQENARKIGFKRMMEMLKKLNYPGMIFSKNSLDNFWLEGKSKITQFEQIDFLYRYWNNQLPIKKSTKKLMDEILFMQNDEIPSFYGKTGWAIREGSNIGWFVGFVQSKENTFYIALNANPSKEMNMDDFPNSRITAARLALKLLINSINETK